MYQFLSLRAFLLDFLMSGSFSPAIHTQFPPYPEVFSRQFPHHTGRHGGKKIYHGNVSIANGRSGTALEEASLMA
ncbi:hypothetical protein BCR34DRAFT_573136 [Clohesyomyces aquaticus]|uniref:Secreted protein n=1 Tax=Clohesyomyces aquaticus TaxID=1231657 RepID=A0A1Y1Z2A4_9PLEO|nr:hypothetical protein BCR34DRAFT_573136 [Clohesyomyces aquaticus]